MKVGDILGGRYEIEALLGAGGMGSVWRARHLVTGKQVAIKTLLSDSAELRARFLREARAACAVDHENVVAVHDVFDTGDGTPAMVMDYLRGESLRERLGRVGRLSEREAVSLLAPVVAALRAAHASGIVHRDLKPENVFVTSAGGVKVLDFGVAKILDDERDPSMTKTGAVIGTLLYMAPEQAFGDPIDARADVWSLGVMLFEALVGRRPIQGETAGVVIKKLAQLEIPKLASAAPEVSARLGSLCDRMLAGPPDERPALEEVARVFAGVSSASGDLGEAKTELGPAAARPEPSSLGTASTAAGSTGPRLPAPAITGTSEPAGSGWKRVAMAAIGLAGVAAAYGVWSSGRAPLPPPAASASAPAPAASAEPPLACATAEATRAYDNAVAAQRGSDWPHAEAGYAKALDLDPECAPAAVQLLLLMPWLSNDQRVERYRSLYKMADRRRSTLSPRDAALLDATQAYVAHDVPDTNEGHERLVKVAASFPDDAHVQFLAARGEHDLAKQLAGYDRVVALDPGYLDVTQGRASVLVDMGRGAEAEAALDACAKVAPGGDCALERVTPLFDRGDCAQAERVARDYLAASAGTDQGYAVLAQALAGRGAARAAVEEAIAQLARKTPAEVATYMGPVWLARLDLARGAFASAERRARELDQLIATRPDAKPHEEAAAIMGEVLAERGTAAEVRAYAEPWLGRHSVWSQGWGTDFGSATLLQALDASGAKPHAELFTASKAWLQTQGPRGSLMSAHAMGSFLATTREELAEYETAPPDKERLAFNSVSMLVYAAEGRLALRRGQTDRAADYLRHATRTCWELQAPGAWVRSHLWLGQALEAKKDDAGACAAYAVVLERWGVEKPLGRTAKEAQKRRDALRCPGKDHKAPR